MENIGARLITSEQVNNHLILQLGIKPFLGDVAISLRFKTSWV